MLRRLYQLREKIADLQDKFFYWSKAQSPKEVAAFYFKLKALCVMVAIVGTFVICCHVSYISHKEAEALRIAEQTQVEKRRRERRKQRKPIRQVTLPAEVLSESELTIR